MTDDYLMGRTPEETERLMLQARALAAHSMHLIRLAGITPGMHVLDAGCGADDVSMLLAELVGPHGTVTGIDMDPAILEVARARAADAGLPNVSFIHADLTGLRLDERADALIDLDTLTDRLTRELKEAGATYWSPELAAAWARIP